MKFTLGFVLFVLVTSAMATPSPYPAPPLVPTTDDNAIYLGPTGAMLETDYFGASRPRYGTARIFPCQPHLRTERTHAVVQACD